MADALRVCFLLPHPPPFLLSLSLFFRLLLLHLLLDVGIII